MLTIHLPNMTPSKQTGQEGVFNKPREPHRDTVKNGHSGADVVEISAEGRRRLEEEQLVALEAARIMKTAGEVARLLRESVELKDADQRSIYRPARVNAVKKEIGVGVYEFESRKALETTAESILVFLAA